MRDASYTWFFRSMPLPILLFAFLIGNVSASDLAERQKAAMEIRHKIEGSWLWPPGTSGLSSTVLVQLDESGSVQHVSVVSSSGHLAFDRSVEAAVKKASPLPIPRGPAGIAFRKIQMDFVAENKIQTSKQQEPRRVRDESAIAEERRRHQNLSSLNGRNMGESHTRVDSARERERVEKELADLSKEAERTRLAVESYVPTPTVDAERWHKTIATDWYRGEGLIMGGSKNCDPSDSAGDYIAKMSLVAGDVTPIDEFSESGKVRAVTLIWKNPLMSGMTMAERFFRTKNLCEQYIAEESQNLLRAKDANKRALDRYR